MQSGAEYVRILPDPNGWLKCPICGNRHLKKLRPDETAERIYVYCRTCKNDIPLTLKQGQCFQSQGRRYAQ